MGEMLMSSWEIYATNLANSITDSALISSLQDIIHKEGIDLSLPGNVVIGRDTRLVRKDILNPFKTTKTRSSS